MPLFHPRNSDVFSCRMPDRIANMSAEEAQKEVDRNELWLENNKVLLGKPQHKSMSNNHVFAYRRLCMLRRAEKRGASTQGSETDAT